MIVDSSALVAILLAEEGYERFSLRLSAEKVKRIPAPILLEASIVMVGRKQAQGVDLLDSLLTAASIETIPFTADHAAVARSAFLRYGKGRHPAGLNFGDCISYATAKLEAMPLLFKGDDFRLTDIEAAA